MPSSHVQYDEIRYDPSSRRAVIFIHGFIGKVTETWADFPRFLCEDSRLQDWDVINLGYPSSGLPDPFGIWTGDPDIYAIKQLLATRFNFENLNQYTELALVTHSMGGLVAQRLILDHSDVAQRITHLIMLGTPSNGLKKAWYAKVFKNRQIENMAIGSEFITRLRSEWRSRFPTYGGMPFRLAVVAGAKDQFVPIKSCHGGFPEEALFVVSGDHLSIVDPDSNANDSVRLVISELLKRDNTSRIVFPDSHADVKSFNRVDLPSMRYFQPGISAKDIVRNALQLERRGYHCEAVTLLHTGLRDEETIKHHWSTRDRCDVIGSLGGQLKRLWLAGERKESGNLIEKTAVRVFDENSRFLDLELGIEDAYNLYSQALLVSMLENNSEQIHYHSINVAFLALVYLEDQALMKKAAMLALEHAAREHSFWAETTKAEAYLYLGSIDQSVACYQRAMTWDPRPYNYDATVIQAAAALYALDNEEWAHRLEQVLAPWSAAFEAQSHLDEMSRAG